MGTQLDFDFNLDAAERRELKNRPGGTSGSSGTPGTDTETVQAMIDTSLAALEYPQTDWAQKDSTADDFLKSKPSVAEPTNIIPTASPEWFGRFILYTGTSTGSYKRGGTYECIAMPTAISVSNPQNPHELGWYEIVNSNYVRTSDTTVTSGKAYYTFGWQDKSTELGTAASVDVATNIQPNDNKLATSNLVYRAIAASLSSVYKARGEITFAGLVPSLLTAANVGNVYTVTTAGTTSSQWVQGAGVSVAVGDAVGIIQTGADTYKFNHMGNLLDLTDYVAKSEIANTITEDGTMPVSGGALYAALQDVAGEVQADWAETSTASSHYILNKPELVIPVAILPTITGEEWGNVYLVTHNYDSNHPAGTMYKLASTAASGGGSPVSYGFFEYDSTRGKFFKSTDESAVSGKTYWQLSWANVTVQFGTAATEDKAAGITPSETGLVTGQMVYSAIQNAVSSVYKPHGIISAAAVTSDKLVAANLGNIYTLDGSVVTDANWVQGAGITINSGTTIGIIQTGSSYKWNAMGNLIDLTTLLKVADLVSSVDSSYTNKPVTSAGVAAALEPLTPVGTAASGNDHPIKSRTVYNIQNTLQNQINNLSTSRSITGKIPAKTSTVAYRLRVEGIPTWGACHMPICVAGEGFKEFILKSSQSWSYPGVYTWDELTTLSEGSLGGQPVFGYGYHDAGSGYTYNGKLKFSASGGYFYVENLTNEAEDFAIFGQCTGFTIQFSVSGGAWTNAD